MDQEYTRSLRRILRNFSRRSQEDFASRIPQKTNVPYEFGPFRLEVAERWLLKDGNPIPLPPKAFDTLLVLVQNAGHLVQKEKLLKTVWPDVVVEEGNLTQTIFLLRKTLGETARQAKYIETAPRLGYRFVAPVTPVRDGAPGTASVVRGHRVGSRWNTRRKAWSLGLVFVALAGTLAWVGVPAKVPAAGSVRSVAVLPFKPLAAQHREESLEIGIADALITRLSSIGQITVRPTNAVLKYSDSQNDPATAGRELGVDAVLDGKIQRAANRIRVTVQLVRVRDAAPLWAQTFDSEFSGIFAVQDAISEQVAGALLLKLTPLERRQEPDTQDPEAYELYLKSSYFWRRRTEQAMKKSIQYLERAIQRDPNYAVAHAALATSYGVLGYQGGLPPAEAYPKVKAAAKRALQIDDKLADAHIHLGSYYVNYEWNWLAGERELRRAIELNPRSALAHSRYAFHLEAAGRIDESRKQQELARQLDQDGGLLPYADAAVVEANPDWAWAHFALGTSYLRASRFPDAVAALDKGAIVSGRTPYMLAALGCAYGVAGRKFDACKVLDELNKLGESRYVSPFDLAIVYSGLGEKQQAFKWLEKSYQERTPRLTRLKADPWFARIASDARFSDLVRRVGVSR